MFERDMHFFDALYGPLSVFEPPEQKTSIGSTAAPFSSV